jgi:hypothetical protein
VELRENNALGVAAVLVVVLALGACGAEVESELAQSPIQIEEIEGSDTSRITLSESAAERLDIQTASVASSGNGFVVPSAAVNIDPSGVYWVYTSPDSLVFIREQLSNAHEEGLQTFFDIGPGLGMAVVTTGVPELYGAEIGIGK